MTKPPSIPEATARVREGGIVAIIRGRFERDAILNIADALIAGGLTAMEVTLNSPGAIEHIAALKSHVKGKLLIGAGTVRDVDQVGEAYRAGAEFLVSPSLDVISVMRSTKAGILHLPGVFTPTEAETAYKCSCRMLKLFPCDVVGPAYLKALRAPLDDVDFVPTGGVSIENIAAWRKAGAAAVAMGTALVSMTAHSPDEIASKARALSDAWKAAGRG
jgi:2-dehydro-3-deoxyphosphogluconate aldolase/(4S)-4-hydroxy-2-oxoglutarate aldolase